MFQGKKINLCIVREKDLDKWYDFESNIGNRGDFFGLDLSSESGFKKEFQSHGFWSKDFKAMLITSKDNLIIGKIECYKPAPNTDAIEIAYLLYDKANYRKGYVTDALNLFIRYLYIAKNVNRLQLLIDTDNLASKRVAGKCGFKFEGILRQANYDRGKYHDLEMHSLLRKEWNDIL